MARLVYNFENPDRFLAGTVGQPGNRTFYLQARDGDRIVSVVLEKVQVALLAERLKSPWQKGQPFWDKIWILPMMVAWCAWLVLMGLDAVRFRWSVMPVWLQCAGAVVLILSFWMIGRVFRENPFLTAVVRIQAERGHRVVSTGPYATIRHPLYASMLIYLPANALVLGSWAGLAASVVFLGGIVFRTAMEDRELQRGLSGYTEYAARVRYRLIPFIW